MAQDEFALLANVDRSYFGKLERGERQPSLALLLRIAKGLGLPGASLVQKTELRIQALRSATQAVQASASGSTGGLDSVD